MWNLERAGRELPIPREGSEDSRVRRKFKNNGQASKVGLRVANIVFPHFQTISLEYIFVGLSSKHLLLPPTFNEIEASS